MNKAPIWNGALCLIMGRRMSTVKNTQVYSQLWLDKLKTEFEAKIKDWHFTFFDRLHSSLQNVMNLN